MTDQLQDPLTDVVGRFVAAESALDALRIRQAELREAASQLHDANSEMDQRTVTSVEALEAVRADLRRKLEDEHVLADRQQAIDAEVAEVMAELRLVLEQLRAIDPARVAHDLSEIRRDGADNASELRELRRLTDSVEQAQNQITRDGQARAAETDASLTAIDTRIDRLQSTTTSLVRTSKITALLLLAVLATALLGLIV